MAWIIVATVVVGIFALVVIVVQAGMIRTAWRMVEYTPPLNASDAVSDPRAESVSFKTSDGLTLNAVIFQKVLKILLLLVEYLTQKKRIGIILG